MGASESMRFIFAHFTRGEKPPIARGYKQMPVGDVAQVEATATQDATDANEQEQEFVFETWLESQDEKIKGGLDNHVAGLKSALKNERTTRETLEKRIKTLSSEADKGSKLQGDLEKLGSELTESNVKIEFFKDAATAKVIDFDLAWLAAKSSNLFDRSGNVDMRALREAHPALFAPAKTPVPPANQGNGRGQEGERRTGMNEAIRNAAGRR